MTSKRYTKSYERPVNRETFIKPWPEVGLIATNSPLDPRPSLTLADGRVVEMDGVPAPEFDLLDRFIAAHSLDLAVVETAMATDSRDIARMLVDINISRDKVLAITRACTARKLSRSSSDLKSWR